MPRSSAAAAEMHEHAVAGEPMAPPAGLSAEEARDWAVLADAGRLGCDQAPLLTQLVRAMARSRRIAVELAALGERSPAGSIKAGREAWVAYLQLAAASREEAKLVAVLCVKMRLAKQTKTRLITAERERERTPTGPRPWDATERSN